MLLEQGQIHLCTLASDKPKRAVVVLSRAEINVAREKIIVALITAKARQIPFEIPVGKDEGLSDPSVIHLGDVYTVAKSSLGPRLGVLSSDKRARLDQALRLLFQLP